MNNIMFNFNYSGNNFFSEDENISFIIRIPNRPTNIRRVNDIISNYNNLTEIHKLYPSKYQFYNLFRRYDSEQTKIIAKRIQILLDLLSLSFCNSQTVLDEIKYKPIEYLEKIKLDIDKKHLESVNETIKSLAGGSNNYSKKYDKYIQKYKNLKISL